MNIEFYTFDKKYNSTKRPTGTTPANFECLLKSSSSIISPTIELNIGLLINPSQYNYAYIDDYKRYYWISEWTFTNTTWVASLNVDVLATWKPYIGSADLYVYRSSAESDGALFDKKYPTTSNVSYSTVNFSSPYEISFKDGVYVVGVFGKNVNSTSVCYYVFTPSGFTNLLNQLYATVNDNTLWDTVEKGLRNSLLNISNYLKSCIWLPLSTSQIADTNTPLSSIDVGSFTLTSITCYRLANYTTGVNVDTSELLIPKHPQAGTRGKYCNLSPISRYKLIYMPYGVFELDTTLLQNNNYMLLSSRVDPITGQAVLRCFVSERDMNLYPTDPQIEVFTATSQIGVDIPITMSTFNISALTGGAVSTGISVFKGNIFGIIAGAVASACELATPNLDIIGQSKGSLCMLNYSHNVLQARFFTIVDEDNAGNGRPLHKIRKPSNLGGYIEAESSDFSCPATDGEQTDIRRFIDNGFYYE